MTSFDHQTLWLDSYDADRLRDKKIWIVDDVCASGNIIQAIETLIEKAGGQITQKLVVFKEGEQAMAQADVLSLGYLPFFE